MEIRYTNTPQEVEDYIIFKHVNSEDFRKEVKRTRRMYFFMTAAVALFAGFQLYRINVSGDEAQKAQIMSQVVSMATIALFSVLFSFLVPKLLTFFTRREVRKQLKKDGHQQLETVLNIDDRSINWVQGKEKGTVKLTSEILAVEKPLCYYIDTRKAFFVVPKRVFENDEQLQQFIKMMNLEPRLQKTAELLGQKK